MIEKIKKILTDAGAENIKLHINNIDEERTHSLFFGGEVLEFDVKGGTVVLEALGDIDITIPNKNIEYKDRNNTGEFVHIYKCNDKELEEDLDDNNIADCNWWELNYKINGEYVNLELYNVLDAHRLLDAVKELADSIQLIEEDILTV